MADDGYHKKLGEMQKYVPFLETTIKRLKSEKDKPREAQISKLQSLLVILTDSKKKLKLDALKKCEEVILKLYDKVEKKPPVTMMHKYMCRTPPEEKSLNNTNLGNKSNEFDSTFLVARQKLKQSDATPASPSPPLEQQIIISKPVVIPTEKITTNIEPLAPLQNPQYNPNWENHQNIPQTLNWPVNAFNPDYSLNMNQVWQDPNSQNWTIPSNSNDPNWVQQDLYKRKIEPDNISKNDIWDRKTLTSKSYKHQKNDREIISYSDALSSNITSLESSPSFKTTSTAKIKIVGNNKEIIPIDACSKLDKMKIDEKPKSICRKNLPLPPPPQSRKSLEKEILPLNKPPLTDRDIQDLLSPVTESSSGGHSPIFNEDMDLEKLEELKAKLCKELEDEKPKHKKKTKEKDKIMSPTPVSIEKNNPTPVPVSSVNQASANKKPQTKVVKELTNVFGTLLSSIDEQIMGKSKDKKAEKKDPKKEDIKKVPVKEPPKIKDKKDTKLLNVKDVASMNDKIKSAYFKTDDNKDKIKTESSSSTSSSTSSNSTKYRDSSSSRDSEKKTEKKKDECKKSKEETSSKDNKKSSKDADHSKRRKSTDKQEKSKEELHNKTKIKEEFKIPVVKSDEKLKEIIIPKEIDDKVFKTVEDIMKNLKESINKPMADPLSKFGDLVKEKSDQLCDNKPVELPPSGRLSDKYPHKRKSIDSRAPDSPLSDSNVPKIPQEPVQPVKLSDPRLKNTKVPNLLSPPIKELHFIESPQNRNIEMNRHNDFDQRNFNKPNPEFSFQNSYNNMNNPNNFNRGPNKIFCNEPPNDMHHVPFSPENPGCRTPGDPFIHSGPRTPVDPFLNSGPRTPADPFLNQVDQFMNTGPPRTPGDPFLGPGNPPIINPCRPPGPDQFHNFNQFVPNEPMRNQFRNEFPMNRNQEPFNPNHDQFNPNHDRFNPNWNRPNQFPPMCDNRPDFNNQNPRFNQQEPNMNQYDLSQMNPIDFYDTNGPNNNNNRFEPPEFNNPNSFRGRGNCNIRGNFGVRGRGGPDRGDRNPFRDPRQFRNKGPPMQMPNKFPPNEEPPHKEDTRRSRFDDARDSRDHRGDRDYRRSRFSKEEEHRNDRSRSTDDRYNRFAKREEPVRKPAFVREDPRRKSIDETVDKPKEVVDKPVEKQPVAVVADVIKSKEEIQSPLDSLYSTETKRVGKGYGLQSFKIPKIKKTEEAKEEKDNKTTTPEEVKEDKIEEKPKEEPVKEDAKTKEEVIKPVEKSPDKKEDVIKPEPTTSKPIEQETKESPKTEADLKLDMFNNFMKHIFETCDSSVLFQYLDKCGFTLPNSKTKRIRRIIDSDSSDTDDEHRKEDSETDKPTPEPPAETPEPEEPKTNEREKIVETVSERIKSRRRKPVVYSSDSSPDKSQKKGSTPEKETEDPNDDTNEEMEKVTRKSRSRTPKPTVKTQAKARRKNALELLQEDIREMFISEGVLTATGKRMCRMMKEHQESGFISSNTEVESTSKQQKDVTESDEEIPLVKRKEKLNKTMKHEKSPETVSIKRSTRKSPRVILEKIEISSKTDGATSTDHSDKESGAEDEAPEIKKPPSVSVRRTRRSNTISGEFLELDENGVVAKVQEKKKRMKANKSTTDETDALDTSFEDDASIKSESNIVVTSKKEETPVLEAPDVDEVKPDVPVIKKKKIRRRGRGGWATGVIKNKKKKAKSLEKNPDSPALTMSTEEQHDADPDSGESDDEAYKNKSDAYDEEYSLLKVDVNKDVNYYLDNGNKFNCKLCDYKGKLIVHHYRSKHPESENMISRLSPEQASAAKIESNEFNFEEIIPYEEATKGKKRRTTFICRFCLLTFKQEFTCSFFDHICCHTGEYRYKCEKCTFSTGVKKTLSAHCHSLHLDMEKPLTIKPIYEGPPNFRLVFGYLCSACNFTQLLKVNVEKHIRVSHPDQDITIIKISMSTKPIPLTDLKKPGEEPAPTIEANEMEVATTPESPKSKEQKEASPEVPKSPNKSPEKEKPEAVEHPPEVPAIKEKEPNLTVFMVPEEISQQEKLIETERLKKMEEIQSNVVPRRPKLQFVDKLKNKLDSVESEIALLESMEAEAAAMEAEAAAAMEVEAAAAVTMETETAAAVEGDAEAEATVAAEIPETQINDKPTDGWIAIASTCSLANAEHLFDDEQSKEQPELEQNEIEAHPEIDENLNETNSFDELENEPLDSLNLSPLSQNTKKSGFLDTIQRLAAQLQNNKPSSLSDCEDGERLYYSPEVTPENSPNRKAQLESAKPIGEALTLNAGSLEIQFFDNKNLYLCLIPGCLYTTNLKTSFRKHLMDEHLNLRVCCGLCVNEKDYMEWDLCGLFLHMLDQHKPETPVKNRSPLRIKEEPVEQPEIPIKTEILSPDKQPEVLQPGSIRLRRISGDILSSFSAENSTEYPTISIPENVVSEPDINEMLRQEEPPHTQQEMEPVNETGFLQISNVRTLTPEEENHLQIKTAAVEIPPKAFKKIVPKAFILNMGELATSGVTKIVNNAGSAINLKRVTGKEGGKTYNFTLKPNIDVNPALLTQTISNENKPTKTIILRKTPPFLPIESGSVAVPKLTLLKSPKTLTTKGFIAGTAANLKPPASSTRKITFVTSSTGGKVTTSTPTIIKAQSALVKAPVFKSQLTIPTTTTAIPRIGTVATTTTTTTTTASTDDNPLRATKQFLQPLRLNKTEFILSLMMEYPKIMDFYKCPGVECAFSTNDCEKFQKHFAAHNQTLPGKYCVYCLSTMPPTELVDHLERKHGNCMYQCALCFYRACFDMYIAVHQSFCHQLEIPKFYTVKTCPSLALSVSGLDEGLLSRFDAILPYYCRLDGCNRTFYTMNDFRVHMKIFHKRNNVCSICKFELNNAELLVGHYVTHNIANFQCRYCKFGSEKPQVMLRHYAMEHYNKNPIVYKREYKTGTTSGLPDEVARLEDIVEINLSYLVKSSRCVPQQPPETQNHIPAAASTFVEETNETDETQATASSSDLPEHLKDTSKQLLIDPKTGEMIPPPEKESNDGLGEPEITLTHRNEQSLKAIVDAVDPLHLNEGRPPETEQNDDHIENETETETEEYYEDSGLSGCELYVCGTSECGVKLSNLKDFKDHMYSCDVLTNDVGWYTCFHCKKRFKYVGALIKHLTVHGPQKYTCSLCPAKAHLETLILKHMKVQHKIPLAKLVPIDKTNADSDLVAVAIRPRANKQKSKKDDELYEKELQDAIKHTREQIELFENDSNKVATPTMPPAQVMIKCDDKNSFGPDDIEKLPRPPIFAQEIKCKVCSYNTKVRSNMLKHLKAHIENKPVAETAPVNPVPCLEKNELMFDKMTNLAASSHTGGRMGAKKEDKAPVLHNYPGFIAASKRFVCGSNGCNYLTHGDSMLRHHLSALHVDETNYKCPHCQVDLAPDGLNDLAVNNIMFHLKMHDLHLYKCNECQFYHYQKHKIERHVTDQHPNSTKIAFTTIRELDNSANLQDVVIRSASASVPAPASSSPDKSHEADGSDAAAGGTETGAAIQQPWRCGFCSYKSETRGAVQSHAASVHRIRSQFKCGSCEFRCSAKNNYQTHFKNKHPNEKVVIMSVYYKVTDEATLNLSSSDAETMTAAAATTTMTTTTPTNYFDTTPLWTKNKTGVKHIRGILLDDAPVAKRPKIIEKLSENATDADDDVKTKRSSPQKSADTGHNLRFPATYGTNRNSFYKCPTCNIYETKNSKEFIAHLYKEINYFRYVCNFCPNKSTQMVEAQKHFKESHSNENIVNNKQICTVLRYNAKAEKWVEKCLQVQQEGIHKYGTNVIKQEPKQEQEQEQDVANSSTETLLLQIDEDKETADGNENENLEKPQLTPQLHRRSSRVTNKPNQNLNESFESNDSVRTGELSPPILEPQIPDAKQTKKIFKCEHCMFVAKASGSLQMHVRKHFEVKPYKCNLCNYAGGQLAHLQSHFYFKHTSEPLQYTLEPVSEVPQCRPIKRKRAISDSGGPPTKMPTIDEPVPSGGVVKAEPQTNEETKEIIPTTSELPAKMKVKSEQGATNTNEFYICYHCPRRSPALDLIRKHFFEAHEKTYKNLFKYKKLTIDKPKKTKYSCQYCEWLGNPDSLKQHHFQKHIDKEYMYVKDILLKCELCTEVFNKMGLLKKHFSRSHPNQNLFYQSITKENDDEYIETFEVIEEVLEVKTETAGQEINCSFCVLSFSDVGTLRAHHDLVHNHLEFNKATDEQTLLKKYKCPQCEHTSNSFPAMRDHLRNHNKPYKCGHCDVAASYPSILKTHHIKEHRNLTPSVIIVQEAQERNEELRDNLMHLQNGEYVKIKDNLKRQHGGDIATTSTATTDEPPTKKVLLGEEEQKRAKPKRRKSVAAIKMETDANELQKSPQKQRVINVARKSTATPPRIQNVAKKSTTPRPYVDMGFTYYGTKPLHFDDIKNIRTELPIMGKNMPLNIGSMSQILQLFPVVVVDDIAVGKGVGGDDDDDDDNDADGDGGNVEGDDNVEGGGDIDVDKPNNI